MSENHFRMHQYQEEDLNTWRPEYRRALKKIDDSLDRLPVNENMWKHGNLLSVDVLQTDAVHLFACDINARNIPSLGDWFWNQTQSHKQGYVKHRHCTVRITKLVPRRRKKITQKLSTCPSLKMWMYELEFYNTSNHIFALWCERGIDESTPDLPALEDLRFLSHFMVPSLSNELWPANVV